MLWLLAGLSRDCSGADLCGECTGTGGPTNRRWQPKYFLKQVRASLGAPNVDKRFLLGNNIQRHALICHGHTHISHLLRATSVEAAGDPQNCRHALHSLLVLRRQSRKIFVFSLGVCATMVTGHVGDEF